MQQQKTPSFRIQKAFTISPFLLAVAEAEIPLDPSTKDLPTKEKESKLEATDARMRKCWKCLSNISKDQWNQGTRRVLLATV